MARPGLRDGEQRDRPPRERRALAWPLVTRYLRLHRGDRLAYWMYIVRGGEPAKAMAEAQPGLYQLLLDKWRIDELYEATVLAMVDALADTFAAFDAAIVDGVLARLTSSPSWWVSAPSSARSRRESSTSTARSWSSVWRRGGESSPRTPTRRSPPAATATTSSRRARVWVTRTAGTRTVTEIPTPRHSGISRA